LTIFIRKNIHSFVLPLTDPEFMMRFYAPLFLFLMSINFNCLSAYPETFEIQLEYLYLKPSFEQPYYAISSTTFSTVNGPRENNVPDFHSAFRAEGVYNFCNSMNDVVVRFTYLNGSDKDREDGTYLFDTQGFPGNGVQIGQPITGSITSDLRFKYYAGDVVFGQSIFDNCIFDLSLFGGVHVAYIEFRENIFTFERTILFTNELTQKSELRGIGPEIGIDFQYLFSNCCIGKVSLVGSARGALLINETQAEFQFTTGSPVGGSTREIKNKDNWKALPVFELGFGLNFEYAFKCFITNIEIGYEAINYRNAINTMTFFDDTYPGNSSDNYSDLSFHGPYAALKFVF